MHSGGRQLPPADLLGLVRKKLCSLVFALLANKSISGRPNLETISVNTVGSSDHSSCEINYLLKKSDRLFCTPSRWIAERDSRFSSTQENISCAILIKMGLLVPPCLFRYATLVILSNLICMCWTLSCLWNAEIPLATALSSL